MKKFYITTPIYYINDQPHVGHFYTTLAADILARWHRAKGDDVFFSVGTDENSQKTIDAAKKKFGKNELSQKEIKLYVDEMAEMWKKTWKEMNVSYSDFIRTGEERHQKTVQTFIATIRKRNPDDIYISEYVGLYCVGCENFKTESDLEDGKCPDHGKKPEEIREKNYFFRNSRYRDDILGHIESHPDFILPQTRRNEVISYLKDHFTDFSISRSLKWGFPFPGSDKELPDQAVYVWFDALTNYLTVAGYPEHKELFEKWWPAQLHLVGKDIIKFHCALWPAMLLSAGLKLPEQIFAHGFFRIDGKKMSKTLGNVIHPLDLKTNYGLDATRYLVIRNIVFGDDGDFSLERLAERYNADLVNGLGNVVARVLAMVEKYDDKITNHEGTKNTKDFSLKIKNLQKDVEQCFANFQLDKALEKIWEFLSFCDNYIEEKKPWVLAKEEKFEELEEVLENLLVALKEIGNLLLPFMPETGEKILEAVKERKRSEILFPRKEKT